VHKQYADISMIEKGLLFHSVVAFSMGKGKTSYTIWNTGINV
jgi:hypothetical protein